MKSLEKNIQNLDAAFDHLFEDFEMDYDIEARVLASKVLSEISEITEKNKLSRKKVAELIGTSASYLTQLYRGNKLLNFVTLAKLKDKLNLNIEIKIKENIYKDKVVDFNYQNLGKEINQGLKNTSWQVFKNLNTDGLDPFAGEVKSSMKLIKQQLTA